jgi:hypothetical protein
MRPVLALCLLAGCSESAATTRPQARDARTESTGIEWRLRWAGADDVAFAVTNDLGVRFDIDVFAVVTAALSLVPCGEDTAALSPIGLAFADHAVFTDPSEMALPLAERAGPRGTWTGSSRYEATRYCKAFWLVGRGGTATRTEDGIDMSGSSLRVTGRWTSGELGGDVQIATSWTDGVLLPWPVDAPRRASATVVRDARAVWDGIDPTAMSSAEIAWALLENLMASASLQVEAAPTLAAAPK